jgi:hypothetical protein
VIGLHDVLLDGVLKCPPPRLVQHSTPQRRPSIGKLAKHSAAPAIVNSSRTIVTQSLQTVHDKKFRHGIRFDEPQKMVFVSLIGRTYELAQ